MFTENLEHKCYELQESIIYICMWVYVVLYVPCIEKSQGDKLFTVVVWGRKTMIPDGVQK